MTGEPSNRPRTLEEWIMDGHGATPDQFDVPDSPEIAGYTRQKIAEIANTFRIEDLDQIILLWRRLRLEGMRYHTLKHGFENRILVREQIEELERLKRAADQLADQIKTILTNGQKAGAIAPALLQIDASIANASVAFLREDRDDQNAIEALSTWTSEFSSEAAASYLERELTSGRGDELFPQSELEETDFYSVVFTDCAEAGHVPETTSALERAYHYSAYVSLLCSVIEGQRKEARAGRPSKPHARFWSDAIARYWVNSLGRHDGIDKSGDIGGSQFEHFAKTCFDLLGTNENEWESVRAQLSKRRTGRKPK